MLFADSLQRTLIRHKESDLSLCSTISVADGSSQPSQAGVSLFWQPARLCLREDPCSMFLGQQ
jgi:hypothetical protein